jgi:hypothetical protein
MRTRSVTWTVVLIATLAGCSQKRELSVNILPVPPQDSRWQGSAKDRIALPLASRQELEDALRYGLDQHNKDRGSATDLNAPKTYGPLLDLLSKPTTLADLSKPEFKKWFPGELVTQVVDARDAGFPKSHGPVAVADAPSGGKYWWIFDQDNHGNFTAVMVVNLQALTTLVERKR